ncbi:MAG: type I restriction endonuclease subunit R [Prevotella sp.]|jgi:type I restriction enzyme R subunit
MAFDTILDPEREVQNQVISLLHNVHGYRYLGNLKEQENSNIRKNELMAFLTDKQHCTEKQAKEAVDKLFADAMCTDVQHLYDQNKAVYHDLRYPTQIHEEDSTLSSQTCYIDWQHPERNSFGIAEEVTVRRNIEDVKHRRPDLVVYVNGIALCVLELKKDSVTVADAIRQNIRNQEDGEIFQFFTTVQLIMAGNGSEGLHYGVIKTPEKYWLKWKEPTGEPCDPSPYTTAEYPNELYRSLLQMLEPKRLLEFIHDFIVFDAGIKKAARPNQYFAIKAAEMRVAKKESGIIWQSQGSGKSLIMVWLAQWIRENVKDNPRVVIITDRDELDKQIETGFKNTEETMLRVRNGNQLIKELNSYEHPLICSLVHKFGLGASADYKAVKIGSRKSSQSAEEFLENLSNHLPEGFKAKGNLFVFVDECHRTQSGILNNAMKKIMGKDVMLIGFTGTPLLKADKQTSIQNFGPYIHTYKYDEAVKDGVVLDLRYEARNVEQKLQCDDDLDQLFDLSTVNLTPSARAELAKNWATMRRLFSTKTRMRKIVIDILKDMATLPALRKGYGNAMLVAGSIYQAFRYWKLFQDTPLKGHCAVVSSYVPQEVDIHSGHSGDALNEAEFVYDTAKEMMGKQSAEKFEETAKKRFIDEPGDMKLLIVVDKLLTGFDAPSATYMYIDKEMRDHNLFQAICRVNRVNGAKKEYGYIIDYKDLFNEIESSIEDYTNGAFSGYDPKDVEGILGNHLQEAKKDLDDALDNLARLTEPVAQPKGMDEFYAYLVCSPLMSAEQQCEETKHNQNLRDEFYFAVRTLAIRYLAISTRMKDAGYTEQEAADIYKKVKDYDEVSHAIMLRSGDIVDLKQYDATMRQLLDDYVEAKHSEVLAKLDDFSFLDLIDKHEDGGDLHTAETETGGEGGMAETLTANVRRVIMRKRDSNPEEYDKFSARLNQILEEMREGTKEYKELMKEIIQLCKDMKGGHQYPQDINTPCKKALYDNLDEEEDLVNSVYMAAEENAEYGWRDNNLRKKKLQRAVKKVLPEEVDSDKIMNILTHHDEI